MKGHCSWRFGAALVVGLCATPGWALDPFGVRVDLDNDNSPTAPPDFEAGFSNVDDAINVLTPEQLQAVGYNGIQAIGTDFNFRGLPVAIDFRTAGSGDLTFSIPGVRFNNGTDEKVFTPTNGDVSTSEARRDTLRQLKEYLKTNGAALKVILTQLARFSPIDPLAGNPDSLFGQRMRNDFNHGFTNKVSQIWGCGTTAFNFGNDAPIQVAAVGGVSDIFAEAQSRAAALQAQNEIGIGVLASSTTAKTQAGDYASTGLTLPLSYTAKLDSDPRKKIRFDLPLTYVDTEGAATYSLGAGLAYTHPLSDVWSLTPAVGVGATGSEDLGAAGGVGAYSLTSAYTWRFDGFALSMGNSIGRYEALGLKLGDIEAEAEIANTVYTNGFLLTGPNSLIARNLVIEYSFVDTRITGDEVYSDGYDEIGVALGYIDTEMGVIDSYTKLGLSYLVGDGVLGDINSLRLNLTARF